MKKFFIMLVTLVAILSLTVVACNQQQQKPADATASTTTTPPADATTPPADATTPPADATTTPTEITPTETPVVDVVKIAMSTDTGGVNDKSFNQGAWEGLQKAQTDLGIQASYLESTKETDYEANLNTLADQGNNVVWGIGFKMADAIAKVASERPGNNFAIIDNTYDPVPQNVVCVTFKEEEGSFLVGVIAAKMSVSKKVGFLGGIQFPLIEKFMYGFKAGVKAVDPTIEVIEVWANSFSDSAKGKALALELYNKGCDVIYHASGDTGNGLFEAAKEKGAGFWAIGVDKDQYDLAPQNILTSMMKRVDNAIYKVAENLKNGQWDGGKSIQYGLADGGVDIAPTTANNVPAEVLTEVDGWKQKIINGEIIVPFDKATFDSFNVQ